MSLVSVQSSNLPERSVVEETAAIVASLTNSTCQAAAALAYSSPTLRSRADMIAGENDLAACSLRAACQIDASSNLHVGEKSPDFAMKSGLDVSSRVPKVTSAA